MAAPPPPPPQFLHPCQVIYLRFDFEKEVLDFGNDVDGVTGAPMLAEEVPKRGKEVSDKMNSYDIPRGQKGDH